MKAEMTTVQLLLWVVMVMLVYGAVGSSHGYHSHHHHHHHIHSQPSSSDSGTIVSEDYMRRVTDNETNLQKRQEDVPYLESVGTIDDGLEKISQVSRSLHHIDSQVLHTSVTDPELEVFDQDENVNSTESLENSPSMLFTPTTEPTVTSPWMMMDNTTVLQQKHIHMEKAKVLLALELRAPALKEISGNFHRQKDLHKRFIISSAAVGIGLSVFSIISGAISGHQQKKNINEIATDVQDIRGIVEANSILLNSLMFAVEDTQDQLLEVQQDLQVLSQALHKMRDELKVNTEFNAWLTTYINWEFSIYNGEEQLNKIMLRMEAATSEVDKLKHQKEYIDYYLMQDIEGSMNNIFQLTANKGTSTTRNLFNLYVSEKDCEYTELIGLLLTINSIAISAAKQIEAYYYITGSNWDWVHKHMSEFYTNLYGVRRQFEWSVWYCLEGIINNAVDTVWRIANGQKHLVGYDLTLTMHHQLTQLYPIYDWAVVHFKEAGNVKVCNKLYTSRGEQFFTIESHQRRILVFYKDRNETHQRCADIQNMNTFIPFTYCDGCTEDSFQVADSILSGKQCMEFLPSEFKRQYGHCLGQNPSEVVRHEIQAKNISFFAGGVKHTALCLRVDPCSGHGECKHIPYTVHHMCLCQPFYSGVDCSRYQSPDDVNNVTDLMVDLRQNVAAFNGIPNEVDIYFEVRKLSTQLTSVQKNIQESIRFNRLISLYSSVFTEAEFIAITYDKMLSGKMDEKTFAEYISQRDFPYIFSGLEILTLGKGRLVAQDLLTSFKRVIIAENGPNYACSEDFGMTVSKLMKNIAMLDLVIAEANIRGNIWKMKEVNNWEQERELLEHVKLISEAAKSRQKQYSHYWENTSCGKITDDDDIVERYCDKKHSYEGMTVTFHCKNNKNLTTPSATCKRENETLKWDSNPSCVYLWGNWGSWSTCSKSCDTGVQVRTRNNLGDEVDTDTRNCTGRPCSDYQWGRWGHWSSCSRRCDTGRRQRTRNKPVGEVDTDTETCKIRPCTDYTWGKWGSWCSCSKTCNPGMQRRTRWKPVGDVDAQMKNCNRFYCSALNWSSWSKCKKCRKSRSRTRTSGSRQTESKKCFLCIFG